jgi:hypothetical protein
MTTTTSHPGAASAPAHPGPAEIRAALAEAAGGIESWDRMLDKLYAQAVETGSLESLEKFLADSWRSVQIARSGPESASGRVTRESFLAHAQAQHGQSLLDAA